MKTTIALSSLLAILPAFITATPLRTRQTALQAFTLLSIHSTDPNVHNRVIDANDNQFWVGRSTSTFCPEDQVQSCPAGNTTVLAYAPGLSSVSTSHGVPGEQSVYIAGPDAPTPGALQFNAAHASPPAGSITDRFAVTYDLEYLDGSFFACPAEGAWYITTVGTDSSFCVEVALHILDYDGPQPAAWEYV